MGGTGSKQEDQIITVAIEKATGTKFTYVPFKGGGDVAVQLVGKHIDSSVNNPIEAGCAMARRRPATAVRVRRRSDALQGEGDRHDVLERHPTLQGRRASASTYLMLRGIFMPAGVTKDQVDFYVDLFKKVRETADWKKFMEDGAFNTTFMAGPEYAKWVENAENTHKTLMKEAGFLAP
jgi:putative tricarboxylic transport membrane protein